MILLETLAAGLSHHVYHREAGWFHSQNTSQRPIAALASLERALVMNRSRHRSPLIRKQPVYVLIASLMALGLLLSGLAVSVTPTVAQDDTKVIELKGDHRNTDGSALDCQPGQEILWHFVITMPPHSEDPPSSITVEFRDAGTVEVNRSAPFQANVGHYDAYTGIDDILITATATIFAGWEGQFNLSSYSCSGVPDEYSSTAEVRKLTVPPGSEAGWDFELLEDGTQVGTVTTVHSGYHSFDYDLQAGSTYQIVETGGPDGWTEGASTGDCEFTVEYPRDDGKVFQCEITNELDADPATAEVQKVTVPEGEEAGWEFSLMMNGSVLETLTTDGSGFHAFDYELVENASYQIVETNQDGWSQVASSNECEFEVSYPQDSGRVFECTITNAEDVGTNLVVQKIVDGESADQLFDFDIAGPAGFDESFSLGGGELEPFANVDPGEYTVTEDLDELPDGWELTDITIDPAGSEEPATSIGDGIAVVAVESGQTVTVTFTNLPPDPGTITIVKNADSADTDQAFDFTGDLGEFSLEHDESETADGLTYGDTYRVTETVPSGWTLEDIDCDDATVNRVNDSVDITLFDEDITCTFFNEMEPVDDTGQIVINKEVDGEADGQEFAFTFNGEVADTFTLEDGDSETFSGLPAGEYTVAESLGQLPPGWNLTEISGSPANAVTETLATGTAVIQLDPGQTVEVTFTNTPPPEPEVGTIVVEKIADEAGDATFDFTVTGGTLDESFSLGHQETETFADIDAGQYTVTELLDQLPEGWSLGSITVSTNGATESVSVADGSAVVDLASGETITVTFTNDETIPIVDEPGEITIVKDALGAPEGTTFPFSISGVDMGTTTFSLGHGEARTFGNLEPGEYTVGELVDDLPDGWNLGSIAVDPTAAAERVAVNAGDAVVNLGEGQTVTVTFVNDETIPIVDEPGEITVIKEADGAAEGATFPFSVEGEGLDLTRFSLGHDGSRTFGNLEAGEYIVSELLDEMPDGWSLGSITITSDDSTHEVSVAGGNVTFDLSPGETVRIMFTNDETIPIVDEPFEITIVKEAEGAGIGTFFPFRISGEELETTEFWLGNGGSRTFGNLAPGTYSVAELIGDLPGQWELEGISVSPADRASAVDVQNGQVDITGTAGDSVRVTFSNETDVTAPIEDEPQEIPVGLPATGLGGAPVEQSSAGLLGLLVLGLFALGARFGLHLRSRKNAVSG